jgi:hypothetical protein
MRSSFISYRYIPVKTGRQGKRIKETWMDWECSRGASWKYSRENIIREREYSENILRKITLRECLRTFSKNEHLNFSEHFKALENVPRPYCQYARISCVPAEFLTVFWDYGSGTMSRKSAVPDDPLRSLRNTRALRMPWRYTSGGQVLSLGIGSSIQFFFPGAVVWRYDAEIYCQKSLFFISTSTTFRMHLKVQLRYSVALGKFPK